MRFNKNWILVSLLAAILLVVPKAMGNRSITGLPVRAKVPPEVYYSLLYERESLSITKANKCKGYVDIGAGTVVAVTTNDPNGYILVINSQEDSFFTNGIVSEGGESFPFFPGGTVEIHEIYQGPRLDVKKLSYRFYLDPEAMTGEYPWPIMVSAHPL